MLTVALVPLAEMTNGCELAGPFYRLIEGFSTAPGVPTVSLTLCNGIAFTGEGKLVRKATGYEQEKLKPRHPTSGSRAARAELPAPVGAYR